MNLTALRNAWVSLPLLEDFSTALKNNDTGAIHRSLAEWISYRYRLCVTG